MLVDIQLCHVTKTALFCVVNGVFHRNSHSDQKSIRTPKEVLYLGVGIAQKNSGKTSSFFGIKSEELILLKRNSNTRGY